MHIVILDDDETLLRTLTRRLIASGHQVSSFATPVAIGELLALKADCYLLDLRFGAQSGLAYVPQLRQQLPQSRILVMTGYASIATAVQAVKSGADDYLTKPMDFSMLLAAIQGEEQPEQELPDDELLSTDQVEWEHIQRVLQQQDGNISQTAKLLGMHRRTLQRKLSKHRP
ncbi:MAG: response regulator [Rheinheimera sp.]|nr:response regulator [Rheinheimera sp.]